MTTVLRTFDEDLERKVARSIRQFEVQMQADAKKKQVVTRIELKLEGFPEGTCEKLIETIERVVKMACGG